MRYVRFLKTPRVVHVKNRRSAHVSCLITITSDLGESFLPCSLTLSAELFQDKRLASDFEFGFDLDSDAQIVVSEILPSTNNLTAWKMVRWSEGMRDLPIILPLSRDYERNGPLVVRIGTEPKSDSDEFDRLLHQDSRGVVSVWSAPFNLPDGATISRTVERRFKIGHRTHRIFEETDESIARHVWDAGVALSCQLPYLLKHLGLLKEVLANAHGQPGSADDRSLNERFKSPLHVIELGSGCGIVSVVLSHLVPITNIYLTDLAEARAIAVRNITHAARNRTNKTKVSFSELDWGQPDSFHSDSPEREVDLVVAADCTYNADSSPAFVSTIQQIALRSPHVTVVVAMKRRHLSEEVFFDLMSNANFRTANTFCFPLPGDEKAGEENMELYIYKYHG